MAWEQLHIQKEKMANNGPSLNPFRPPSWWLALLAQEV